MKTLSILIVFIAVVQVSSAQSFVWEKQYVGFDGKSSNGFFIAPITDGYVVTGIQWTGSAGVFYVVDGNGNYKWDTVVGNRENYAIDATTPNFAYQTSDGGIVLVGTRSINHASPISCFYLLKMTAEGRTVWEKYDTSKTHSAQTLVARASAIDRTQDNGYIIASGQVNNAARIMTKTDSNGNYQWRKEWRSPTRDYMREAVAVHQTLNGGYFNFGENYEVAGTYLPNVALMKNDSAGNLIWEKTWDYGDTMAYPMDMLALPDGGAITLSYLQHYDAQQKYRYHISLLQVDSNGNEQWRATFHPTDSMVGNIARRFARTNDGGYLVVGFTMPYNDVNSRDAYVLRVNKNGVKQWDASSGTLGVQDEATWVSVNTDGSAVLTGFNGQKMYIAKITDHTSSVPLPQASTELSIVPNPVTNVAHISIGRTDKPVTLRVYNAVGELVSVAATNAEGMAAVDTHALPTGVYRIIVWDADGVTSVPMTITR